MTKPERLGQAMLVRTSICACGFPTLDESIPLGTLYTVDLGSRKEGLTYGCGGCGEIQPVDGIKASSALKPEASLEWFPAGLFDLGDQKVN